ncbi:MAG: hypothetical protein PHP64_01225 [Actinomycetota bacterium]|nr:hypothetical protein [Actinomycetota bacterium]
MRESPLLLSVCSKKGLQQAKRELIELVFPSKCVCCGLQGTGLLCSSCLEKKVSSTKTSQYEYALEEICDICKVSGVRAGGEYRGETRELVMKLKSGYRESAIPLGRMMVVACGNDPSFSHPDIITFVPSERKKVTERGYNPAELLARAVSSHFGRKCSSLLVKTRKTFDQDELPRTGRQQNVKGAFEVSGDAQKNRGVLLVDDVLTTGATVLECASTLFSGGATSVHILVAALVPLRVYKSK